jgi:hypothetical protein
MEGLSIHGSVSMAPIFWQDMHMKSKRRLDSHGLKAYCMLSVQQKPKEGQITTLRMAMP